MKRIIIIGGGASGLMAAIKASETAKGNVEVIIIEKNSKVGKKILISGNGKCNFTNLKADKNYYNNPTFAGSILEQFNVKDTLKFFEDKALYYEADEEMRVYPYSYNANTLLDILLRECEDHNIKIITDTVVKGITKNKDKFVIKCQDKDITGDIVICSIGGKIGSGKIEDNYDILRDFNLRITRLSPALVPLYTPKKQVSGLSGIRVRADVSLIIDNQIIHRESGEVLFKEEGLSGISIFNSSLFYVRNKDNKECYISLDLMPKFSEAEIIDKFNKLQLAIDDFLNGIFSRRISDKIIKDSINIEIENIVKTIKNMQFTIVGTYDYTNAQITSGGIDIREINSRTLEVLKVPNLYLTGELIDIDGECGGFNLQWAWSSGAVAGNNAGNKCK